MSNQIPGQNDPVLNFAHALIMGPSGAIERQEKSEQAIAVGDGKVVWLGHEGLDKIIAMGAVRTGETDDVLCQVTLPPGWELKSTDHSMWSELRDDKGRVRASCFYKGAFYDRNARVHPARRYVVEMKFEEGDGDGRKYTVLDNGTGEVLLDNDWLARGIDRIALDEQRQKCAAFLNEKFPANEDPLAYW